MHHRESSALSRRTGRRLGRPAGGSRPRPARRLSVAVDRDRDDLPGGVLARVGQRLLDDAGRRCGRGSAAAACRSSPSAQRARPSRPARDSSISRARSAIVGCGGCTSVAPASARSTPITSRSSSCAARALIADHAGRPGDLLGRGVGVELERAGVDAEQRDPMREHVVHLPRDPRALGELGFAHAQLLLVLGAARPLLQRQQQLTPCPHVRAETDHRDHHTSQNASARPDAGGPRCR